ncbi:carboxymuconolactone decarboxylase family protein [Sphingobium sp. Sx8-8]|uniref:carboxymuconolactone decarboxylase family protein n=1 Tax=Sphingobium sp. Sx8-8 TaxID=2933617 RepID=UPI001F59382E|nr:carboxymuconolactone decarboxylase family protein [Sphingobium sp. Sx8-8]
MTKTSPPDLGPPEFASPEERSQYGRDWFHYVMTMPAPPPTTPYNSAGIHNFVFAEMWSRPGLDLKARRWITLACVAASDTVVPIQAHIYAALKSGDITIEEMHEFTLHFAVYCGWPKASLVNQAVQDAWARVQEEGGTVQMARPDPVG